MSFTGDENHSLTLIKAAEMTARFRHSVPAGSKIGGFFGRNAIEAILAQNGCVGIRYYYGLDSNNKPVIILVGVTSDENDLHSGELAEISFPCPEYCATNNPLNS